MPSFRRDSIPTPAAALQDPGPLRAAIAAALAAPRIDQFLLRSAIATYVGASCQAGTPLGQVISALNELVDEAQITPMSVHTAWKRQVTLWSVERYFSYRGSGAFNAGGSRLSGSSIARLSRKTR